MRIVTGVLPGSSRLSRTTELSSEAIRRLKWLDYYNSHGHNARLTCRHFDISPQTFYRWKRRHNPEHLEMLENRSRRPWRVRQPTYSAELVAVVVGLREQYPRWGKDKLVVLLKRSGHCISTSMVGRILAYAKRRGLLKEAVPNYVSASKRLRKRPYATRKPKDYQARRPGDIVQLDTLDLRPLPGISLKHFTAHDVVSKWNVMGVYSQASAATAAHLLDSLEARMPFQVRAIQVDGGSEFESIFEEACQRRGIRLFVLPPRSPKLNGGVERAHRTHTEEFYEVTDSTFELAELHHDLLEWETTYNTVRPHQALDYITPAAFLNQLKTGGRVSPII